MVQIHNILWYVSSTFHNGQNASLFSGLDIKVLDLTYKLHFRFQLLVYLLASCAVHVGMK